MSDLRRSLSADAIVLEPIRPELFSDSDSVLGHAIAAIIRVLEQRAPSVLQISVGESTVYAVLNRLLRKAFVVGARAYDERGLAPADQSEEFARSASIGASFLSEWEEVTDLIASALAELNVGPDVIISVDDPDLAPEHLPRILLDLRIVGLAPNIVVVVGLSRAEARRAIAEKYLALYRHVAKWDRDSELLDANGLDATVESQLAKALPPRYSVSITELTLSQRLNFRPIDEPGAQTLIEVLRARAAGEAEFGAETLGDYFMGPGGSPTPYAAMLPPNPRALRGLYYALAATHVPHGPVATRIAAEQLVTHGLRLGAARSRPARNLAAGVRFDPTDSHDGGRVEIDWGGVKATTFHGTSGMRIPVSNGQVDFELFLTPRGSIRATHQTGESAPAKSVDSATFNAMMLLQDLSLAHDTFSVSAMGRAPLLGVREYGALDIGNHETSADGRFLVPPLWEGLLDYVLLYDGWNSFLPVLEHRQAEIKSMHLGALAVIAWWRQIVAVQGRRASAHDLSLMIDSVADAPPPARDGQVLRLLDQTLEQLGVMYKRELASSTVRARDYVSWIDRLLLFACHPLVLAPGLTDRVVDWRAELTARYHRANIARGAVTRALTKRAEAAIDEFWLRDYLTNVNRRLGSSELAELIERADRARGNKVSRTLSQSRDVRYRAAMRRLDEIEAATRRQVDDGR
ncbi:hypothetical protein [Microbacterium sp. PRC9]|uniref:hypothetical protein n=1 Tax=Microbacterium sp. PRC9 TaxID=2962591 RepID=UPI0028828ECC|nr:hypothetical protein [Microbacterium sp. PRC9]MDT0141964.1 hypothetical protein [Microbacterium sp. PRC9]